MRMSVYRSSAGSSSVSASASAIGNASCQHPPRSRGRGRQGRLTLVQLLERQGLCRRDVHAAGRHHTSWHDHPGDGEPSHRWRSRRFQPHGRGHRRRPLGDHLPSAASRSINFSVVVAPGTDSDDVAPVARFTSNCAELTCAFNASTSTARTPATRSPTPGTSATAPDGTGVSPSHTYATAGTRTVALTVSDGHRHRVPAGHGQAPAAVGTQPVPGHTRLVPQTPRTNMPRITAGEITDLEYVGNRVFIAGTFTSAATTPPTTPRRSTRRNLLAFNIDTGLIDTTFRPTFAGGGVTEVEASPGRHQAVRRRPLQHRQRCDQAQVRRRSTRPRARRSPASPPTPTAPAPRSRPRTPRSTWAASSPRINSTARVGLAAVSATTGALVGPATRASSTTSPAASASTAR